MPSSLRRTDILALSHLRQDGRKPHELRRLRVQMMGAASTASSGQATLQVGLTTVTATVHGPMPCRSRKEELNDRAFLQVIVQNAPFSSALKTVPSTSNSTSDRQLSQAASWTQKALEAALILTNFPKSKIVVQISILSDDGGTLCAGINAATLALIDAGLPLKDWVVACAAGGTLPVTTNSAGDETQVLIGEQGGNSEWTSSIFVDLNRTEERSLGQTVGTPLHLPCAILPQRGTLVLAQCDARVPSWEAMEEVMQVAMQGCQAVFVQLQAAVRDYALQRLRVQQGKTSIVLALKDVNEEEAKKAVAAGTN